MARNDVLIIGAGPSGLFAAAELARHGVQARLVEQEVRPHREARATAIQPGTLEILESVGLLPPFLEASEHVRRVRMYGPDMSELAGIDYEGVDCRCEFQCSLPQYETQRILETHLASLGGAVERGVTATKVESDANDDLLVELVHADGGVETVHPGIVIGAGGAHSITRHSMGVPLDGTTYEGHFLVADIAMQAPVPRDQGNLFCGPDGMMLLAPLPGGRWVTFQDLEEEVQNGIRRRRRRPHRGTARWEGATHRRRLVRAVSDAPADRLAAVRRPAVPDRGRRPPLEPLRRGGAQLGAA